MELIYEPATRAPAVTQLAWYDRTGKRLAFIGVPGIHYDLRLSPDARRLASSAGGPKSEMWIDESSWLPLQQKFYEAGSADYIIFHYSDIKKNVKIEESRFKPDWPKNASKVKPRG